MSNVQNQQSNPDGLALSPDDIVPTPTPTPTPTPVQTPGTPNSDVTISTALSDDFTATIMQGRVATLELPDDDVASVRMISGPDYGNVTVNPDNTLAVVLTGTKSTDDLSFEFEVTHDDGSTSAHTANLEVTAGLQKAGWGLGDFYMLETDEDDNVVVEHGENHRKVYVSGDDDALTIADIAALEGKDVGKINQNFFRHNTEYGATEDMALAEDAADLAWRANSGWSTKNTVKDPTSNWLLFEKGYEYNDIRIMTEGESELNPTYIGSYGEGERPIINDRLSATKEGVDHIVIQGLDIRGGAAMLVGQDVLFDDLHFSETEVNIQGIDGFTMRNSQIIDVWNEDPRKGDTWSPHADRESGIYMARVQGALYENNFFDHNGWEDGYDYNLDGDAPQPPSMFSHNVYFASSNRDVTFRDNIVMQGAATGVQMRPGGVIENNAIIDNNSGILLAGGGYSDAGNYSLFTDNLVTSGAHKTTSEGTGARTQGVVNKTQLTTLMDNIVTHLADPNDPNGLDGKWWTQNPLNHHDSKVFYDDTIVYNWAGKTLHDQRFDENNSNIDGLNSDILDETTIQNFTANLLGKDTATIGDLADYLRGQADGSLDDVVDADLIIQFFQTGFGLQTTLRSDAETLRFIPDELGDGVRWDNRLNWSTEDLPGTQDGDSVDLAGNWVYYGGTNRIEDIDFGEGGKLFVTHGYLEIEGDLRVGDAGADLNIDRAGQFWTDGYTDQDMLSINADGGRFANTGLFTGNTELTATDNAQVILASDGADFVLGDDSRLEIIGGDTKVGFDGAENGTGVLLMADDATLSFTAKDGEIGQIREFYSGHFSDSKGIQSGINLGDATLDLDVTDLAGGTESTLISVDELIGAFGDINIAGLGAKQDASIIVDYENDQVLLNLGEAGVGSGSQRIYTKGDANDAQANGDLWDALTNGHGIEPKEPSYGFEIGGSRVTQESADQWHTVSFEQEIFDAHVVLGPASSEGEQALTTRVRNVTEFGFEYQIDEWDYLDGKHVEVSVSWLAGSQGGYELEDGSKVTIGKTAVSSGYTASVDLFGYDEAPTVIATLSANNSSQALSHRIDDVSNDGFSFFLQTEEAAFDQFESLEDEFMYWFAIDAAETSNIFNSGQLGTNHNYRKTDAIFDEELGFFAGMQTANGSDTSTLRYDVGDDDYIYLKVQEEQSLDGETKHLSEQVDWFTAEEGTYLISEWL